MDDIKINAYPQIDEYVKGGCQSVYLKLFNDNPGIKKYVTPKAEIVLCDIGTRDYKICASASKDKNVVEYFRYNNSSGVCTHIGQFTIKWNVIRAFINRITGKNFYSVL